MAKKLSTKSLDTRATLPSQAQSESRYRSLFQNIHNVILIVDLLGGNIIDANPAASNYYGWTHDELCRMNIKQINLLTEQEVEAEMQLATAEKRNYFLFRHRLADGSHRDVEVFSTPIIIEHNSLLYFIINDITDRRLVERTLLRRQYEELKESQQFLANIYEEVNHSIFVVDVRTDGGFRFKGINPVHEQITGMNNEDITGKTPEEFLEHKVAEAVIHNYQSCIQAGKAIHYEESISFRGKKTWWDTTLNPVRNDSGHIYRIIGTSNNITERKQTEAQLKKMSAAVEQSPAVVVITDPEGNIEYVNSMFTELTGYSIEEARGKNPRILQSGFTPESLYKTLWETILSGSIWRGEFHNKKKNGELFWESVVISAMLNAEGVITNFLAVKEDITEQKIMLAELISAKEKAEESDRLKSAFLANISHEIRTPMNGILGFSELLKEPQLSGEEMAEYIDLIQKSGQRMLNLINDLIDISRIDAEETKLQITPTPVNELLDDILAFFKPEAELKGLFLTCTTELSDTESIIATDSVKLNQILTNLVKNALKFTLQGGIDFGYRRKDGILEFYVVDSGIGIPADMTDQVFDRFKQVDNTLTRGYVGAGLGLCITKAYVAMLGGRIWIESVNGEGSTFLFTLPYTPVNTPTLSSSTQYSALSSQHFALSILIAEDDAMSTLLLQKSLKGENITMLCVENGMEAVEIVEHHPEINLVLMDIKMPLLNGFEATRQIKQLRPDLPVIAQSAFTSKEDKLKARQAGCSGFITKPINKTELLNLIAELAHHPSALISHV